MTSMVKKNVQKIRMIDVYKRQVLLCIMAGDSPISVKMAKKEMMTVAMATIPKSSCESSRARIPATTSEIMIPLYLAMAV